MRTLAISHQRDAGPGVFAEAIAAAGHRARRLARRRGRPSRPPTRFGYDAVMTFGGAMHADQEPTHSVARRRRRRCSRELLEARDAAARRLPRLAAAGRGGRAARRGARASPRSAGTRSRSPPRAPTTRCSAPLAPSFEAFQWHSYECVPPPGAAVARPQPGLRAGLPGRRGAPGGSSSTPRSRRRTRRTGSTTTAPTRTRSGSASTRSLLGPRPRAAAPAWNELGRALCRRFLAAERPLADATRRSPASGRRRRARRRPGRSRR